ncbi:hypothetical protein TNCT_49031 [Trichonephila clavata]|uniref:Uncharacterized protein n=1 Tax=Trichonephila clavata TaxID=2740835 RepID=A0A8X6G8C7_TRICU|nr:hypothetical protein TNCT_49031 [Trichonephila clavata]
MSSYEHFQGSKIRFRTNSRATSYTGRLPLQKAPPTGSLKRANRDRCRRVKWCWVRISRWQRIPRECRNQSAPTMGFAVIRRHHLGRDREIGKSYRRHLWSYQ